MVVGRADFEALRHAAQLQFNHFAPAVHHTDKAPVDHRAAVRLQKLLAVELLHELLKRCPDQAIGALGNHSGIFRVGLKLAHIVHMHHVDLLAHRNLQPFEP